MNYYRSYYSRDRFFTSSKVPKLGLDLARLEAIDHFTVWGATHDGRDVRGHYESGRLTVTIAAAPGADVNNGIEILRVDLHVHGGISLGQLCQYADITINGERPPLPTRQQMIDDAMADLSGDWSVFQTQMPSTPETMRSFLRVLLQNFQCHIVQSNYDVIEKRVRYSLIGIDDVDLTTGRGLNIVMGVDSEPSDLGPSSWLAAPNVMKPNTLVIEVSVNGYIGPAQTEKNRPMLWAESIAPQMVLACRCPDMRVGMVSLYTSYRQDDYEAYELLQRVDALIDEVYPATRVDVHDFVTGDILSSSFMHYDPVITHWIQNDPNRWLTVDLSHLPNVWPLQCDGLNGTKLVPVSIDEVRRAASKDDIA